MAEPARPPASPVLRLRDAAAASTAGVRCEGLDGDNWPVTWAEDGWLYAAYGDGWGCRPILPATKRNTGLVRWRGNLPGLEAEEWDCPWFGAGAQPPNMKGCGLLATGGVLYHFLRYQVDGAPGASRLQVAAKLIVSGDGGRTWSGDDYGADPEAMEWFFREPDRAFHAPTFLQAGRGYADAPDDFVYLYAPREARRRANDRLDLARVPLGRVAQREAYEFFAGTADHPVWSAQIDGRQPVLALPGGVSSGDVVYVAGLDRYLLATCSGLEGGASRLMLLDAPRPWGPWTVCGVVDPWGTGAGGDRRYDPRLPACCIRHAGSELELTIVYSDRRPSDKLNWQDLRLEILPAGRGRPARGRAQAAALRAVSADLLALGTDALQMECGGEALVADYAPGWHADRRHGAASLTKLLVGGLSLMAAVGLGRIGLEDAACRYVPAWRGDPLRSAITVRQLATHASGLEDAEAGGLPHAALPGWRGAFWRRDPDPFTIARDQVPVACAPGTRCLYSNPGFAMLAYCLTAALRGTAEPDLRTLLAQRVYRPLGVPDEAWTIGYDGPTALEGLNLYATWGGASFTPRAVAAAGRMLLQGGAWAGREVLPPPVVQDFLDDRAAPQPEEADAPLAVPGLYVNADGAWPEVPRDAFIGAGAGHQTLLVVPSLQLVAVRMGQSLGGGAMPFWSALRRHLLAPLMAALLG